MEREIELARSYQIDLVSNLREERIDESRDIIAKYPDRVPISLSNDLSWMHHFPSKSGIIFTFPSNLWIMEKNHDLSHKVVALPMLLVKPALLDQDPLIGTDEVGNHIHASRVSDFGGLGLNILLEFK